MAEYIDLDTPLEAYRILGSKYTHVSTTLRELLDFNKIPYTAADVVPVRHGRWVKKHDNVCYWHECSECGERLPLNQWRQPWESPYCPNCGEKMDGEKEPSTVETNLYNEEVIHPNCTVQVWRNSQTGEESWGWWENE